MGQKDIVHYRKEESRVSLCGLSGIRIKFTKNTDDVSCTKCKKRLGTFVPKEVRTRLAAKSLQPGYREF